MIVEFDGIVVAVPPNELVATLIVTDVAPAAAAVVTNEPVRMIWPVGDAPPAMYETSVPARIAAGRPEPVRVIVVEDEEPVAVTDAIVSGTTPTTRAGNAAVVRVAEYNRALVELPLVRLPVPSIME